MRYLVCLSLFLVLIACEDMETVVEVELPPIEKKLVIECYLEAGQPYRLLLTETKDYFDDLKACPFVRKAIVVITHGGIKDTLNEAFFFNDNCDVDDIIPYGFLPYLSPDSTRFFNYGSTSLCPLDYTQPFTVEVWDTISNRYATATTQFLPPSPILDFKTEFNNSGKAYALLTTEDDPNTENYYRLVLHETSLTKKGEGLLPIPVGRKPRFDRVLDDGGIFNGNVVTTASNYRFESGDTLIGTIYHLEKHYHDYLESVRDAQGANNSPFGQPAAIQSNITGGTGIFTFLSYDRDTIYVP
ncbi:DUF4249 family protein [Aureispira sp. CCB-E]|uniref:DUF4249 family protein n=1 Tax=Aureispira sp. CCB-E TaxID=3051121 RepID=UPI0028690975|nr:DUF4249 family protein [Aureispira sp. CCB-E]WMX13022.1 DUF4249 family protein [Aureispira sp. CCB-E]